MRRKFASRGAGSRAIRRRRRHGALAVAAGLTLVAAWVATSGPGEVRAATGDPTITADIGPAGTAAAVGAWVPLQVDITGGAVDLDGAAVVVDTGRPTGGSVTRASGGCTTTVFPNGSSVSCSVGGNGYSFGSAGAIPVPAQLAAPAISGTGGALPGLSYRVPVDVPAKVQKHLGVSVQLTGQPVHVELRRGDTTVAAVDVTPRTGIGRPTVGVVADPHASLDALPGLTVPGSVVPVDRITLAPSDIPDSAALLRPLTAVVIDGAGTAALTEAQRGALAGWVSGGGGLVITGGSLARQGAAGVPAALLPAIAGETRRATLPSALGALGGATPPAQAAELVSLTPDAGSSVSLRGPDGAALIVERRVGQGVVVVTAFDPAVEPIASWSGQRALLGDLLARAVPVRAAATYVKGGRAFAASGSASPDDVVLASQVGGVLTQVAGITLPSAATVGTMLIAYILIAGPVSYLVLSRLRRRDLMWLTVPVIAVVAGLAAYSTGLGSRGSAVSASEIRVVHLDGGSTTSRVDGYVALWTPRGGDADISVVGSPAVGGLAALARDDGATMTLSTGPAQTLELRGAPSASIHGFSLMAQATPSGGIATDLHVVGGQLSGTVTNHLGVTLRGATVSAPGQQPQAIGDLPDGASATVSVLATALAPSGAVCCPIQSPGVCSGSSCGGVTAADPLVRRQSLLANLMVTSGLAASAGPVLTAVTDRPIVAPDISGGGASVETLDAVELPLLPATAAASVATEVSARALTPSPTSNRSVGGVPLTVLPAGSSLVYDYRFPSGTRAATVTLSASTCAVVGGCGLAGSAPAIAPVPQGCTLSGGVVNCSVSAGGGVSLVSPSTLPPASATLGTAILDWLDPASGAWTALPLENSGGAAHGAIPAAAVRDGVIILRVTAKGGEMVSPPPTVEVSGGGAAP